MYTFPGRYFWNTVLLIQGHQWKAMNPKVIMEKLYENQFLSVISTLSTEQVRITSHCDGHPLYISVLNQSVLSVCHVQPGKIKILLSCTLMNTTSSFIGHTAILYAHLLYLTFKNSCYTTLLQSCKIWSSSVVYITIIDLAIIS